jgi:anti-sigma-K factor RskA
MSNKDILESGILESYALGMCSTSEKLEVEKLCAENPMLQAELDAIQEALNKYAELHQVQPKPSVKNDIFARINLEENGKNEAPIIKLPSTKFRFSMVASLALFGISLLINIVIYYKYQSAKEQIIALNNKNSQMAGNLTNYSTQLELATNKLAIISNEQTTKIILKGVAKSPENLVMIYWNKETKEVYAEIKNLTIANNGLQYQLWAIVDGKPVNAGLIDKNAPDSTLQKMNNFQSAQAFAITLEKEGGSDVPTLTEMQVIGNTGI